MFIEQQISILFLNDCDTEDWCNDAENSALFITWINYIVKYIKMENSYFKL